MTPPIMLVIIVVALTSIGAALLLWAVIARNVER